MRPNRWLQKSVLAFYVAAQCGACTGWRLEPLAPSEVIARDHPKQLRIRQINGRREVLYRPEVRGDTLWGTRDADARQPDRGIALADVTSVATLHVKTAQTVALGLGFGAVAAVVIALATWDGPLGGCCQ